MRARDSEINNIYHGLRGSASPVLTATGFVNGINKYMLQLDAELIGLSLVFPSSSCLDAR